MSAALPTLTVVAGLIQRHGTLLICQRRRDAAFALQWEFPGGKLKAGESSEVALRRELQEELGIVADIGAELYRTQHDYPGVYWVKLVFHHVSRYSGDLRNLAFEQIRWAALAQLPAFDFLAGDAELIGLLNRGEISVPPTHT
jgi:8-oxo-dGTP diphosphatase